MKYFVLNLCHPKANKPKQKRLYCESVMLQCLLKTKDFELVFIDEFHLSSRKTKFRGWSFGDKSSKIVMPVDDFTMYFIIAVSEKQFYGIIVNEKANTAEVFIHFLSNLLKSFNVNLDNENVNKIFIIDNASIHKTKEVK